MNQKPKGLLSFLFHVTGIAAYRTETHEDIERSFERFGVPVSARDVCRAMRQLSEQARKPDTTDDAIQSAQNGLVKKSHELFERHVFAQLNSLPSIAERDEDHEGDRFAPATDAAREWLLLDYVYAFAYGSDQEVLTLKAGNDPKQQRFANTLDALRGDSRPVAGLQDLCQELAVEYAQAGWQRCW